MLKRITALLICSMIFMCGCSGKSSEAEAQPASGAEAEAAAQSEAIPETGLIGLIAEDDGAMSTYMMMHGFLRTAESLGYPAKLYRISAGAAASVDEAVAEGCCGLLIPAQYADAIAKAAEAGIPVVVPYDECISTGVSVNVVADGAGYIEELARGIAERMTERSLKSGRILVYGSNTKDCFNEFKAAVAAYYPQYSTVEFQRTPGSGDEAAIDELAQFILNNRDIKGLYACDAYAAPIAVKARSKAIALFKEMDQDEDDDDKAKPTPELPSAVPTPNPALLKQISITAFGCGISDANLALFNDNDIYALCIEPYYEAAATATMMLDKLLLGEETAATVTVNRPIAYADTIDKYLAIYNEVKELFGLV